MTQASVHNVNVASQTTLIAPSALRASVPVDEATFDFVSSSRATISNILDREQTASGIANEWEPYNATLLQSMDILMYTLITDSQYKLPLLAPDGNYCPNPSAITEINTNKKLIKIVDAFGRNARQNNNGLLFYIYNDGSVEKKVVIQ